MADTRFVFVVSTSGAVMNEVLKCAGVRDAVHSVIADRPCPAIEKARAHGLPVRVFAECTNNEEFCNKLSECLIDNEVDYVISFYTKFYSDSIRERFRDRIINFHPSLLPAFKGMDGFGDGIAYHAKIIGTTVELIKDVMDEGKIVMQSACAVNPELDVAEMRHQIFLQQCKCLIQVVDWIVQDRMEIDGDRVTIRDAHYSGLEFVPALENREASALHVPYVSDPQSAVVSR